MNNILITRARTLSSDVILILKITREFNRFGFRIAEIRNIFTRKTAFVGSAGKYI